MIKIMMAQDVKEGSETQNKQKVSEVTEMERRFEREIGKGRRKRANNMKEKGRRFTMNKV